MAEKTAEHLSALIDGECPTAEIDLALRRIANETELQARWQRYHLISDTLKNNLPDKMDSEFCQRIHAAIDDAALPLQSIAIPRPSWYKPVAGVAIAASIAAAITLTLDFGTGEQAGGVQTSGVINPIADDHDELTANAVSPQAFPVLSLSPVKTLTTNTNTNTNTNTVPKEFESRINRYLTSHNEKASMTSVHGILPYVTMVGR